MATYETLQVETADQVCTIMLNRPDSLNSVDAVMHAELEDLFLHVSDDASVGAILLRGAGRAFCAGGDVKGMADSADAESERTPYDLASSFLLTGKRIVTRLLGSNMAGGCRGASHKLTACEKRRGRPLRPT